MTARSCAPQLASPVPDVEIELKEYTSADRMLEVLLAGHADITVAPPPTKTDGHVELLGTEEVVVVAAPHNDLVMRFVADLKQRGLPGLPMLASGAARAAVVPGDARAVAADAWDAP